jgi:putative FmdB family regulatory protein
MPTYEYQCTACDHAFEQFQSMKDKTLKKCPKCGKQKLERLIGTGGAIIFKGSGFYQTDYRSAAYKKSAEADGKASSASAETSGANAPAKAADSSGGGEKSKGESKASESKASESKARESSAGPAKPAQAGAALESPKPKKPGGEKSPRKGERA